MSANSFSFGNHPITVINDADTLWFIAAEIVKAINLSNPSVSLKSLRPAERKKIILQGRETNIISESGMYTLVLRSQDALKEGTAAFRFRVWVTDEVLPAIRKTGQYQCPVAPKLTAQYLTVPHQYAIQSAVAKRVHKDDVSYQTVYQALKARFQVPKYTYILDKDFEAAVEFIRTCELRVPEKPQEEKAEAAPEQIEHKTYVVREDFLIRLRTFVYCWRYLFRRELELFEEFLYRTESPRADRFHEAVHNLNLIGTEDQLRRLGFPMDELPCYQHYVKRLTAA